MLKQIQDKPLSQLIVELQQKYQEENNQSDIFQKLYQSQLEQESSTESSNILPANYSGSTGSSSGHSQEGVKKNIKKARKIKNESQQSNPDVTDKKALQMIRNRISAQNSRDRKKAYLSKLEEDFNQQQVQITELVDQVNYLTQQLDEVNKANQQYSQQFKSMICVNCGGRQFAIDEDIPLSVSKNKSLGKLGFSFMLILTIFAFISFNTETESVNLNIKSHIEKPLYRQINQSDEEYQILSQVQQNRIKGMTDIMEYNSEYNYKFLDTTYRALIRNEDSFVNEMINFNKERAKKSNGQALAPLNYHKPKVDSLYCPSVYKYDNSTQGIRVKYQDDQWIHLVVPKDVYIFYQNNEKSIMLKEPYSDQEGEIRRQFQEIWCQVKSVNDFYI